MSLKRPDQHKIKTLSENIFEGGIPVDWVWNKLAEDYGLDYSIRIGADGIVGGDSFHVQLKGQLNVKQDKSGQIVFRLEKKYAEYFLDKVRDLPVFVVVVDVTERLACWLFVQPFLRRDQSWRQAESVLLKIPTTNTLGTLSNAVIIDAKRRMRIMTSGSIQEAIEAQKEHIQELDPRFIPTISVVGNQTHIHLNVKEPVEVTLEFENSDDVQRKLNDMLAHGTPTTFSPGQLFVKGTNVFGDVKEDGAVLQVQSRLNVTASLVAYKNNVDVGRIDNIVGTLVGG